MRTARCHSKAPLFGAFFVSLVLSTALAKGPAPYSARVTYVVDGDTVVFADREHVRLIGINAPEMSKDGIPAEPLSDRARARLQALVLNQTVRAISGREPYDRYHRRLASLVLADGRSAEDVLVREGLAFVIAIPPNVDTVAHLMVLEAQARRARLGIWGDRYYDPLAATAVTPQQLGFHRVRGRVRRVISVSHGWYLAMAPHFSLYIPRSDGDRFSTPPSGLSGKMLEARGWVTEHDGRLRIKIQHPAMIRLLSEDE